MRAAVLLALILSVGAPVAAWPTIGEASPAGVATAAMSTPAGAVSQLVRDSAKAEKTFSNGCFAAPPRTATLPELADADVALTHAAERHALAIDSPPLAPRPPPQ